MAKEDTLELPNLFAKLPQNPLPRPPASSVGYKEEPFDMPLNQNSCSNCIHFVDPSECRAVDNGKDNISPFGWCALYLGAPALKKPQPPNFPR